LSDISTPPSEVKMLPSASNVKKKLPVLPPPKKKAEAKPAMPVGNNVKKVIDKTAKEGTLESKGDEEDVNAISSGTQKDQAPKSYRELKQAGKLKEFLLDHDREMIAAFDEAETEATSQVLRKDHQNHLERVQEFTSAQNRAWAETLSTFLAFSDPSEEETMQ
jgi:hypothetical protein